MAGGGDGSEVTDVDFRRCDGVRSRACWESRSCVCDSVSN